MKRASTTAALALALGSIAAASSVASQSDSGIHLVGNQSSNSSSNSSNGVHTRVDTYQTDDGRGRRTYERRIYRERDEPPRRSRRLRGGWDDDD
jgi:hypothetical protein